MHGTPISISVAPHLMRPIYNWNCTINPLADAEVGIGQENGFLLLPGTIISHCLQYTTLLYSFEFRTCLNLTGHPVVFISDICWSKATVWLQGLAHLKILLLVRHLKLDFHWKKTQHTTMSGEWWHQGVDWTYSYQSQKPNSSPI